MCWLKSTSVAFLILYLCLITRTKANDDETDYDDGDDGDLEDCHFEIDFKTLKKTSKLILCSSLENPSLDSSTELHIYVNHTEEKLRLRASASSMMSNSNRSLVSLTTDIIDDFKYPTSLLIIDNFRILGTSALRDTLLSLINVDLNLLGKNLKKILILPKGDGKTMFSCNGNFYPKQDVKKLNITSTFTKPMACSKEPQQDRFFTMQEKFYLVQAGKTKFRLADIHQDDATKVSRAIWYICNNPASCTNGLQNKIMLDKTINYTLKFLQKRGIQKKSPAG
jgi:hypothetical protein